MQSLLNIYGSLEVGVNVETMSLSSAVTEIYVRRISIQESYHESSNFVQYQYLTKFKWPYFGSAGHYSHVVELAGSPTHTVYVDVTLT